MAHIGNSRVTLRIYGDEVVPEEISLLLGSAPTYGVRKGQPVKYGRPQPDGSRVAITGKWSLTAADCEAGKFDAQIAEVLSQLSSDLEIWRQLNSKFRVDLFCGLFMNSGNEGLELSPKSLVDLGSRGIKLGLDIYGHHPQLDEFLPEAEKGEAWAQYELARVYDSGFFSQNYEEAARWFRKAAEQGHAKAQLELAEKYDCGVYGIAQDYAEAAKWYLKAAEQGNERAQYLLGELYAHGKGVVQDIERAYFWYSISNSRLALEKLGTTLSTTQKIAVDDLIRDWKKSHPPLSKKEPE